MTTNTLGILLAAGQSRRFGADKLLHSFNNGKTLVEHSAQPLIEACPNSLAIVKDASSALAKRLSDMGLKTLENPQAQLGMGSSIACGIRATPEADAWLITLADMPCIALATYQNILKAIANRKTIIAPSYKGKRGHPVFFSRHFFDDLSQLNNDTGARDIIANNKKHLQLIEVDDPGILQDIDVCTDLALLNSQ